MGTGENYPGESGEIYSGDDTDTRMVREPTDRTHMAYAMAYKMNYFLTTDRNLIRYRIPKKIEDIGFVKPFTITLDEFKDRELSK
jgi:predicted nucleic acid-binding protein